MVPKITCIYHINIRCNIFDTFSKRQIIISMNVDGNKVIFADFGRFLKCMYRWSWWSDAGWYGHEPYTVPSTGYELYSSCPYLPEIYHTLYLNCLFHPHYSQLWYSPLQKMEPSVPFMWYVKPSYMRNTQHWGKSIIIWR